MATLKIKYDFSCIFGLLVKAHWENELPELVVKLTGYSMGSCSQYAKKHGLKVNGRRIWSAKIDKWLSANFRKFSNHELAQMLQKLWPRTNGWTNNHVSQHLAELGWKRTKAEYSAIVSRNHKAGYHWYRKPMEFGSTVILQNKSGTLKNGTKPLAVYYKSEAGWVLYKNWLWEKTNGPIPIGFRICFKDGDTLNCQIDNLYIQRTTNAMHDENINLTNDYVIGVLKKRNKNISHSELNESAMLIKITRKELELKRKLKLNGK